MLTIEVVILVYNHIHHGICLRIEFYPKGYHTTDQAGFNFQDPRNIQIVLYIKDYFWYQLWITW